MLLQEVHYLSGTLLYKQRVLNLFAEYIQLRTYLLYYSGLRFQSGHLTRRRGPDAKFFMKPPNLMILRAMIAIFGKLDQPKD